METYERIARPDRGARTRLRRLLRTATALLVGVCSTAALGVGVGAGPAGAADKGYVLITATTAGIDPNGVVVRVLPTSPNRALLAHDAQVAINDMRRAGLDVRMAGFQSDPGTGITITQGTLLCTGGNLASTWPRLSSAYAGLTVQSGGFVQLCPRTVAAGGWLLQETMRHEMGHAVGLAHSFSTLGGRHQTMYPSSSPSMLNYGPGDWNGLREIARRTQIAKANWSPIGHVDSIRATSQTDVQVSGWSLSPLSPAVRSFTYVYDNDRLMVAVPTSVYRADVNRVYARATLTAHGYDLTIRASPGLNRICVYTRNGISNKTFLSCQDVVAQ